MITDDAQELILRYGINYCLWRNDQLMQNNILQILIFLGATHAAVDFLKCGVDILSG